MPAPRWIAESPYARWLHRAFLTLVCCLAALMSLRPWLRYDEPKSRLTNAPFGNNGFLDFHDAVYFPAHAYLRGYNPYSAAYDEAYPVTTPWPLYSPAALPVYTVFAALPLKLADAVYYAATLIGYPAFAAVCFVVCRLPVRFEPVAWLTALTLISRPGHINLTLGQVTLPIALATILALHFARCNQFWSVTALAIATIKPTYGVPLAILLWLQGERRVAWYGIGAGLAAALLGAAPIIYRFGAQEFCDSLGASLAAAQGVNPYSSRFDLAALVQQLCGTAPSRGLTLACLASCVLPAGLAIARLKNDRSRDARNVAAGADLSALIAYLALLISVFHNTYDALLLLPLMLSLTAGPLQAVLPQKVRWVLLALLATPWANYFTSQLALQRLGLPAQTNALLASLNGLVLVSALLVAIAAALVFKDPRRPQGDRSNFSDDLA